MNKYIDVYAIQGKYGKKWEEDFIFTDEMRFNDEKGRNYMLKLHQQETPEIEFRIKKRKEINPEYRRKEFYVSDCMQFEKWVVMCGSHEVWGYFDTREQALEYINS